MKRLIAHGQEFQAAKIIKTSNSIVGYDSIGLKIFEHIGISNFDGYEFPDGYDTPQPTDSERVSAIETYILQKEGII
jgi:hypothetical protein